MQNIYNQQDSIYKSSNPGFIVRPRVNSILTKAVKKPLTIVCAGMGCGKTRAVYDFTQECDIPVAWLQITQAGNIGLHLWELFIRAIAKLNKTLADEYRKLGFPETEDKLNMYINLQHNIAKGVRCIFVFDDFHLLKDAAVIKFMERGINDLPPNISIILISRELPQINISRLMMRDHIFIINEAELNFTENEISQYLLEQGLNTEITNLNKIYNDTKGWTLSVNFVMQMLKKTPGYMGYVSEIIKNDALQLIEMELWNVISERLRHFLLCLSILNHHSGDLVNTLAENDESLIAELKTQNSFIRFNNHMASWHIHPLLLDFLNARINLLSDDEIQNTNKITADWCVENNFIVDAMLYYEKTNDYEIIADTLFSRQSQFLADNVQLLLGIFKRAPEDVFDRVDFFAVLHVQIVFYASSLQNAIELAERYENKYLSLTENSVFKRRALGSIYYFQGFLHLVESTFTDRYDFDKYFIKLADCFKDLSVDAKCWYQHPSGLWTNMTGASRAGAPQEFVEAMARSSPILQKCVNGMTAGFDDLCRGELLFYQGNITEAKIHAGKALETAIEYGQLTIIHRAMFYLLRIAVFQGDYAAAEKILAKMEEQLVNNECFTCVINCEISIAWFYCVIHRPDTIPSWLKEKFAIYMHASTLENFGNLIKARYCCLTNNYDSLLLYLEEKKQRESILFERIEMLAMESCVYYKKNNKKAAIELLREAYETSEPNNIIMPFIELGKEMRAIIHAAESDPDCKIPKKWLKNIKNMASVYYRNQALIISEYKKENDIDVKVILSAREKIILHEMYEGFSNPEIAAKLNLSINTVKMHIGSIYNKLGARNKADIFRIAAENNLLSAP